MSAKIDEVAKNSEFGISFAFVFVLVSAVYLYLCVY